MRCSIDHHHTDRSPVLQRPQLLELLGHFQRGGLPRGKLQQKFTSIGIDAHMQMIRRISTISRVAMKWDRGPREINRATLWCDDDLHEIRIGRISSRRERSRGGRHIIGFTLQQIDQRIDNMRINLRLIRLHVDDDVIVESLGNLGNAVGSALVIRRRQHAARLERSKGIDDLLVIRRDDDFTHSSAFTRLIYRMLHQRPTGVGSENLPGKTCGCQSGGNDNGRSQKSILTGNLGSTQNCTVNLMGRQQGVK